jgi:hypothetical protein
VLAIIDFLGEIGGVFPYLYRGWFLVFSRRYRKKVRAENQKQSTLSICIDYSLSTLFMGVECFGVYLGIVYVIG